MMGQHTRSESLFYYFRLDDQVPENHLLRLVDNHIDFGFVREQLKDSYSEAGRPSIDPELLLRNVHALTELHEAPFAQRWSVDDAPADFIRGQLKGIVGIEIPIARLEGKWKVSQNRTHADRQGVIDGLREAGDVRSLAMADLVSSRNRS